MQALDFLENENEVKIIRAIIDELKAENQAELLIIRIMDQITSKLWSKHERSE